ncbi:hypothetical protein L1987_23007 [Smallanthus sonchifolius]|uniref:Uncharacterized protein n=1 Tax=Smallanthus sonchifolius TaxID=185202 RepID=A0ACB9IHW7_9ASTR|nr:hypothetical protein L1987_23007 [Smallanthus sonchifolius]
MPIFYDVDPSEVRNQNGKYGEAFAIHEVENTTKVESWRKALVDASEIAGWETKNIENGHEAKGIKEIVDTVSDKLVSLTSSVDEDLIGMRARLQDLEAQLKLGSDGVRMVGIWGCGGSGIKLLRQKALITVVDDRFDMHDLVQEMGHYIVRGEHPNNPEKHSRVWKDEEIRNMCLGDAAMENYKTEAIQHLHHNPPYSHLSLLCKIVSSMKKLRWLSLTLYYNCDENVEGPDFLSNELQYINWHNYPISPFPDPFQPMKLVTLKLSRSLQKQLWRCYKMGKLKNLEIRYCHNSLEFPEIKLEMESLVKLYLGNMRIDVLLSSIGNAIINYSMLVKLEGIELAKGFRPSLLRGSGCRLKLPENWSNDFSGFLMCLVGTYEISYYSQRKV